MAPSAISDDENIYIYMHICVFIKLHITAHSDPVMSSALCYLVRPRNVKDSMQLELTPLRSVCVYILWQNHSSDTARVVSLPAVLDWMVVSPLSGKTCTHICSLFHTSSTLRAP